MSNAYQAPQADLSVKKTSSKSSPVTQDMVDGLARGRFWAMVIAVCLYIFFGIMLIIVISSLFTGARGIGGGLLFAVLGFIFFKLARFLHKYSRAIKELKESNHIDDIIESQEQFGFYIKWMGIINIIWILLTVLALMVPQLFMGYSRLRGIL